jgi:20S proteasome subunit alpha 6
MVMNAPRGPSHMRRERQDAQRQRSARPEQSPGKRDKKDKKKEKEKDNAKTTLTDFRIVGIEMKDLGWSWGLVGEEAMNQAEEEEKAKEEKVGAGTNGEVKSEEAVQEEVAPTEPPATAEEVKQDTTDAEPEIEAEPKVEVEVEGDSAEVKTEPPSDLSHEPKEDPIPEPEEGEGKGKTGGKRKAQSPETGKLIGSAFQRPMS